MPGHPSDRASSAEGVRLTVSRLARLHRVALSRSWTTMSDVVTPARRSEIMASIRSKGTKPEMALRRLLHSMGYRYRLHRTDLPGTPDIIFPSGRKIILVHGCFWHQHADPSCKITRRPKSNQQYWDEKLSRNVTRDADNKMRLRSLGWQILVVWECEIRSRHNFLAPVIEFLDNK